MRVFKTLGFIGLFLLAIAGLAVDIGYIFYLALDKTKTTDVFYSNDQTPVDLTEVKDAGKLNESQVDELEDRKLFEVNIYSNSNENKKGVILEELKINYFTDSSLKTNSTISTGMQYVSDYDGRKGLYTTANSYVYPQDMSVPEFIRAYNKGEIDLTDKLGKPLSKISELCFELDFDDVAKNSSTMADNYISPDFEYYQSINFGVTWDAKGLQSDLKRDTEFIIKLGSDDDAEAYMIKLDGVYDTRYDNSHGNWSNPGNYWPWNWNNLSGNRGGRIGFYNWDNVFDDIMNAVITNDQYTGTHYGSVDLSRYFSVTRHYNNKDKKWEPASDADQKIMYAVIKFNYHTEGAVHNKQSLFGIIADDPRFIVNETTYDTDYAQSVMLYNLTPESLDKRYSKAYNGYLLSLSVDLQRRLKTMPPHKINIVIDLDKKQSGELIVGLDVNAFDGFEFDSLIIKGNNKDFYLLNNSLRNTKLVNIDIADTITIFNFDSGVEL